MEDFAHEDDEEALTEDELLHEIYDNMLGPNICSSMNPGSDTPGPASPGYDTSYDTSGPESAGSDTLGYDTPNSASPGDETPGPTSPVNDAYDSSSNEEADDNNVMYVREVDGEEAATEAQFFRSSLRE